MTLHRLELQLPAHILSQPPGDLNATDVFSNGVMGARLGNQYSIPGFQLFNRQRPTNEFSQIAFKPGKENRKGSEGNVSRVSAATLRKA